MPITLPSFVAPNELIQSSWGNAVVNALDELDDEKVDLAGDEMSGQLIVDVSGSTIPIVVRNGSNVPAIAWRSQTDVEYAAIYADSTSFNIRTDGGNPLTLDTQMSINAGGATIPLVVKNGNDVPVIAWRSQANVEYAAIYADSSSLNIRTDGTNTLSIVAATTIKNDGTSSRILNVDASNNTPALALRNNAAADLATLSSASALTTLKSTTGDLAFGSADTERARIAGTAFLFGKTSSDLDVAGVEIYGTGSAALGSIRSTTAAAGIQNAYFQHQSSADADTELFAQFARTTSGTVIGSIDQNGTTGVRYNTTSDARLKTDVGLADVDGLDTIGRVTVRRYRRTDGSEHVGMFAQELVDVIPNAVTAGGDDPEKQPWMTAYSNENLIGNLILAVQQLSAEVEALRGAA